LQARTALWDLEPAMLDPAPRVLDRGAPPPPPPPPPFPLPPPLPLPPPRRARPEGAPRPVRQDRWIPDGDLDRLDEAARGLPADRGDHRPAPDWPGGAGEAEDARTRRATAVPARDDGDQAGGGAAAGSLADALEPRLRPARAGQLKQLDEDIDLGQLLETPPAANVRASLAAGAGPGCRPAGCPTVAWTGRRIPTRYRRPAATPPGCVRRSRRGRGRSTRAPQAGASTAAPTHVAARSMLAGRPISTHPVAGYQASRGTDPGPHVGLIIGHVRVDASYEYALGPIAWILTDGLGRSGGRCATALFGNSAELARRRKPTAPLVPGIRTAGGHRFGRRRDRARLRRLG